MCNYFSFWNSDTLKKYTQLEHSRIFLTAFHQRQQMLSTNSSLCLCFQTKKRWLVYDFPLLLPSEVFKLVEWRQDTFFLRLSVRNNYFLHWHFKKKNWYAVSFWWVKLVKKNTMADVCIYLYARIFIMLNMIQYVNQLFQVT